MKLSPLNLVVNESTAFTRDLTGKFGKLTFKGKIHQILEGTFF